MLFHFFNKKTLINDEFVQDVKSLLKLYSKQSFSAKPTKIQAGYKLAKAIADDLSDNGGEIEICFKHDLANVVSGYLTARENLLPPYGPSGLYLTSGKISYSFYWDGSIGSNCVIPVSSLTDGAYYIAKLTVAATLSFTLQKVTKVGNLNTIGAAINSTTTPKGITKANADMGVFAGCYSSGSLNNGSKHEIVYIKFKNNMGVCISEVYFCNGNENLVTDVCAGSNYTVLNEDDFPSFWNHKQDYFHYNFRYGHTVYYNETSELYLRIPNKKNQTEIILASIPSGYSRIANYKECRLTFNNCENTFKLDDVSLPVADITISNADIADFNKTLAYMGNYPSTTSPYWKYTASTTAKDIYCVQWFGRWFLFIGQVDENVINTQYYGNTYNLTHPDLETDWRYYSILGNAPIVITKETSSSAGLYTSDIDLILFNVDGTAKEIDLKLLNMASISDRGYLYYNETLRQSFMLYGTNKTLENDVKIIKYIGMSSRITYTESGTVEYDENNHAKLTEV